jgi:hypothetical protein
MMRVTATICALATQSRTENGEPSPRSLLLEQMVGHLWRANLGHFSRVPKPVWPEYRKAILFSRLGGRANLSTSATFGLINNVTGLCYSRFFSCRTGSSRSAMRPEGSDFKAIRIFAPYGDIYCRCHRGAGKPGRQAWRDHRNLWHRIWAHDSDKSGRDALESGSIE